MPRVQAWWTLSTAANVGLFACRSNVLAAASVAFCAAEDCMSAAVTARLVQAGAAAGLSQARASACPASPSAPTRAQPSPYPTVPNRTGDGSREAALT